MIREYETSIEKSHLIKQEMKKDFVNVNELSTKNSLNPKQDKYHLVVKPDTTSNAPNSQQSTPVKPDIKDAPSSEATMPAKPDIIDTPSSEATMPIKPDIFDAPSTELTIPAKPDITNTPGIEETISIKSKIIKEILYNKSDILKQVMSKKSEIVNDIPVVNNPSRDLFSFNLPEPRIIGVRHTPDVKSVCSNTDFSNIGGVATSDTSCFFDLADFLLDYSMFTIYVFVAPLLVLFITD